MKIAVTGKGGCGKSTVTTLVAMALAQRGKEVLIVDSDESNYGLHCQLGMDLPGDFTGYFGGKQKVLGDLMLSQFSKQFFNETWKLSDIPEDYYTEKDGIKLMASGKIHVANEGCACAMGTVLEQFITHLQLEENQFALLDMEAGIEHFGRGIDNGVDLVLMIVDPSYESLRLSRKIADLAESIGKPIYYVLNKVTADNRDAMMNAVADPGKVAAILPHSREVLQAGLMGQSLNGVDLGTATLADFLISQKVK